MSKLSQREAVYTATHTVLKENGITHEDNSNIKDVITDEHRTAVSAIICEGFKNGDIDLKDTEANKKKLADDSKLKAYVSGLMSNWYRKDKRFNGNVTYVATNPGSRAGQGDSQMKNLRLLKKQFEANGKSTVEIDAAIEKRGNELKAAKAKDIEVDLDKIPAELRASLGLDTTEDSE